MCPATYAEALKLPYCSTGVGMIRAGSCGDLRAVQISHEMNSWRCFYSTAETRELVGRMDVDDAWNYCARQSSSRRAGEVDPDCAITPIDTAGNCGPQTD